MISEKISTIMFMPGHTIEAIIKKENKHDVNKEELNALLAEYLRINGPEVPRPGFVAKIPILLRHAVVI
jgi:hypothetical protein